MNPLNGEGENETVNNSQREEKPKHWRELCAEAGPDCGCGNICMYSKHTDSHPLVHKEETQEWISVIPDQPKPEYMQTVLIHDSLGFVTMAQYGGNDHHPVFINGDTWHTATHWQPLPKPPVK